MIDVKEIYKKSHCDINILVVGDVMIDEYFYGNINRLSPESPVPVFNYKSNKLILGGAANVAANLVAMGAKASIASVVGDDKAGDDLIRLLKVQNIDTSAVEKETGRQTTIKTRFLNQNNTQILRLDKETVMEISRNIESKLISTIEKSIASYDIIIMSDYCKGLLTVQFTQKIIALAKKNGKKVIVDVKDKNYAKYTGAYMLKPNLSEMKLLTGMSISNDDELILASKFLKSECKIEKLLVTLGSQGMMYFKNNEEFIKVPTKAKEVFDVTGAGDTVIAYVAWALAIGVDEVTAVQIANYAAGVKVAYTGTTPVSIKEVLDSIEKEQQQVYSDKVNSFKDKILDLQSLVSLLKNVKGKIVFTNGCFDILHIGHVSYLEKAKKLGEVLVVGLNTDKSIKRLKGESRPILTEDERAGILASLGAVDYVVLFDEDTPLEVIKTLKPNILVKGKDYVYKDVVGSKEVLENGGEVKLIDFVDTKSTTNIVNKIKEIVKYEEKN